MQISLITAMDIGYIDLNCLETEFVAVKDLQFFLKVQLTI